MRYLYIIVFLVVAVFYLSGCLDNIQGRNTSNLPKTITQEGMLVLPDDLSLKSQQKVAPNAKIYIVPAQEVDFYQLKISDAYPYVLTDDKGEFKLSSVSEDGKYDLLIDINDDKIADGYFLNLMPTSHYLYLYVLSKANADNPISIYPQKYVFEPGEVAFFTVKAKSLPVGSYKVVVRAWKDNTFYPVWESQTLDLSGAKVDKTVTWNMPSTVDPTYSQNGYVRWYAFLERNDVAVADCYFVINSTNPGEDILDTVTYNFSLSPETVTPSPQIEIIPSVDSDKIKYFLVSNYSDFRTYESFALVNEKVEDWTLLSDTDGSKNIYFKLVDKNGNISQKWIEKSIYLDRQAPEDLSISGYHNLLDLTVNLSFHFTEDGQVKQIYVYKKESSTQLSDFTPSEEDLYATQTAEVFSDSSIEKGKNYYYKFKVEDWAGNMSAYSPVFSAAYYDILYANQGKSEIALVNSSGSGVFTKEFSYLGNPYMSEVLFSQQKESIFVLASNNDYANGARRNIYILSSYDLSKTGVYNLNGDVGFIRPSLTDEEYIISLKSGVSYDIYFFRPGSNIPTPFLVTPFTNEVAACVSKDGDKIVFQTDDNKIYLINYNGTGLQYLTTGKLADWQPSNQILYLDLSGNVKTINADGSMEQLLISDADSPHWMIEDGVIKGIIFRRKINGIYQIMLSDIDGSNIRQITDSEGDKIVGDYH